MEEDALSRLAALSHPLRLGIFRLLMRRYPDALRAGDIVETMGVKPSTASVYLANLRDAGLIDQQRRGTALLYSARLAGAQDLVGFLMNECCRGRPDMCPPPAVTAWNPENGGGKPHLKVLFVCTGNSARSLIAEALLRDLSAGRIAVFSAGVSPRESAHPAAIEVLQSQGHDVTSLRPQDISALQMPGSPHPDVVITLCDDAANRGYPAWPDAPVSTHWGVPDPLGNSGAQETNPDAFRHTYDVLRRLIETFLSYPFEKHDRIALQTALDEIATHRPHGATTI